MARPINMFIDIREAVALSGRHANTIKRWGRAGNFKWSKPGGTRNAPWTIDRASFIASMRDERDHARHGRDLAERDRREVSDGTLLIVARLTRCLPEGVDFDILSLTRHDRYADQTGVYADQTIGRIMRRGVSPDR
jgi:hypothetical protein